jgi:hypothetical protein
LLTGEYLISLEFAANNVILLPIRLHFCRSKRMAHKTAVRGRPKGSGVDDAASLAAVAELIAANPGMKPTTAIKALGITNPSAVRRLRDKYQQRVVPQLKATSPSVNNVITLSTRAPVVRREPVASPAAAPSLQPASESEDSASGPDEHPVCRASPERPDLLAAAFAASLATAKAAIHLHYKSLWYAFQFSPYAMIVRNAEFTRLALSSFTEKNGCLR